MVDVGSRERYGCNKIGVSSEIIKVVLSAVTRGGAARGVTGAENIVGHT